MAGRKRKRKPFKFLTRMKKKLFIVFFIIIGVLIFMIIRLAYIELKSGDKYEKIVLTQQEYSSRTIPFRRGDIVDRKGTVLATSTDVYNVILDCSVITSRDEYLEPTLAALGQCFDVDLEEIRSYIAANPDSKYYVLAKKLPYEDIAAFEKLEDDEENGSNIKGIWFEKEYERNYPYGKLGSCFIGFTTSGDEGIGGLEDYYNDVLNGTDGREYGYLNSDSNYQVNVKEAVNGETVVSTVDATLQEIVENKIQEYSDALGNEETPGGAKNIGVIMMDPNTGEVLAMADYPDYDLTDPWDLSEYYTDEELDDMSDQEQLDALNEVWKNFCITYTYEPGSTAKPFTVASGLETGTLTEDMTFFCDGVEQIRDYDIHCVNRNGHGEETIQGALEDSCNDALMQMSYLIGVHNFVRYQQIFNFGLKTNIDLPGESRTDTLVFNEDNMMDINLATNAFGQDFNVTMIQMASAFSSLINGGYYYQPHMVSKLEDEDGNTIEEINPVLLKRTVSADTCETIKGYLEGVVSEGTGNTAKVDGYSMLGKTGTAQKFDEDGTRAVGRYLVSFVSAVPADDPQVVLYVVIDEPAVEDQAHSTYAQNVAREIYEEALPYLNIYPDEEKTGVNANVGIAGEYEDDEEGGSIFDATEKASDMLLDANTDTATDATEEELEEAREEEEDDSDSSSSGTSSSGKSDSSVSGSLSVSDSNKKTLY